MNEISLEPTVLLLLNSYLKNRELSLMQKQIVINMEVAMTFTLKQKALFQPTYLLPYPLQVTCMNMMISLARKIFKIGSKAMKL